MRVCLVDAFLLQTKIATTNLGEDAPFCGTQIADLAAVGRRLGNDQLSLTVQGPCVHQHRPHIRQYLPQLTQNAEAIAVEIAPIQLGRIPDPGHLGQVDGSESHAVDAHNPRQRRKSQDGHLVLAHQHHAGDQPRSVQAGHPGSELLRAIRQARIEHPHPEHRIVRRRGGVLLAGECKCERFRQRPVLLPPLRVDPRHRQFALPQI